MGFFSARPRLLAAPQYRVILFDVNETLLDMSPLKKAVNKAFDHKSAFQQWFGLLLQHALVDTVTDQYHDFSTIGDAALDMTAHMLEQKPLKAAQKQQLLGMMTELPAHADVAKGLQQLLDAGYSLVAFTNSAQAVLDEQLHYAGLMHYFEQGLTVELAHRYKPHLSTYRAAVTHLGVAPEEALLVAAHGWDVAGAQRAGLDAGFIARPGQTLYPLAPPPLFYGDTLVDLAEQLVDERQIKG
jgi:2-haloacid dehalogenase